MTCADESETPLSSEDAYVQEAILTHIPTLNAQEHLISR